MKKAIVTFGVGGHKKLLDIARPSFKAFAKRHGYDYFEAAQVGHQRPAAWYKVRCLIDLLKHYEHAIFFGCDLVVVDGREDFPLPANGWIQAMVTHHTQCGDVPNDDMWICTSAMIPWLEKVWALDKYLNHGWWEQAALLELMSYDPAIEHFPTHCRDLANQLYQNTYWLSNEWNVHCWDKPQPQHVRIQHATMWPDRAAIMRTWAKEAEGWINDPLLGT